MSRFFVASLIILAAFAIGGALFLADIFFPEALVSGSEQKVITIRNIPVTVSVADTSQERVQGLSGVPSLGENEGMLFMYDKEGAYSFWMKDMRFPIDIIWVGKNFTVVDVTENALPSSFPSLFEPKELAQFVIEVNAGWSEKNKIETGTSVRGIENI